MTKHLKMRLRSTQGHIVTPNFVCSFSIYLSINRLCVSKALSYVGLGYEIRRNAKLCRYKKKRVSGILTLRHQPGFLYRREDVLHEPSNKVRSTRHGVICQFCFHGKAKILKLQ